MKEDRITIRVTPEDKKEIELLDAFFKQLMVVINRIEFNSRWSIKQTDIFMNQLKIPQTEDELSLSIIDHPVTEVAHREVLKDIRKMSSKKHELDNE